MDHNIRTAGNKVTIAILAFCFFPCFILGIGMLVSYPNEIWLAGLMLILCSILIGGSVVSMYKSMQNEKKASDRQMGLIDQAKKNSTLQEEAQILANWVYNLTEWKTFLKWETQKRKKQTVFEAGVVIVLGTLLIRYGKDGNWITAICISASVGTFYGVVKYFLMMRSIKLSSKKQPEVIITTEAIVVNGRMNRFYGNNLWLGKVEVKEEKTFNILEVTYCWGTRKGKTYDEIRVPIPKGSLKEAIKLQDKLMTIYLN